MFNKHFEKIFNLSKKTGDKFIVLPNSGDPFVIVPFTEYEKIINLTPDVKNLSEAELLDKINRDIAIWKDSQDATEDESELDWSYYTKKNLQEDQEPDNEENWLNPLQSSWATTDDEDDNNPWLENLSSEDLEDLLPEDTKENENFDSELEDELTPSTNNANLPEDLNSNDNQELDITNLEKETLPADSSLTEEIWFQPPPKSTIPTPEPEKTIKYEDIPPPPPISPTLNGEINEEKPKIIDMSFEESNKEDESNEEKEEEFAEEPVY